MAVRVQLFCLLLATVAGLVFPGSTPSAEAADRTEILIREGVELRRQGKNLEASQRFAKAYEQSHTPRAAAQLGLCEQALERWVDADLHLSEALAGSSEPWVARKRKTLEAALRKARSMLSTILVHGDHPNAQVHVNGEYVGNLPEELKIRVLPGVSTVNGSAAGYAKFQIDVSAEAGKQHKVTIVLKPLLPEVSRERSLSATVQEPTVSTPAYSSADTSTKTNHKWLWIGTGVVVAAAIVGIVVYAASGTTYPDTNATRDFPPR